MISTALVIALRANLGPRPFEKAYGLTGILIGIAVGCLSGLIAYPWFGLHFFTLPDDFFRFITTA